MPHIISFFDVKKIGIFQKKSCNRYLDMLSYDLRGDSDEHIVIIYGAAMHSIAAFFFLAPFFLVIIEKTKAAVSSVVFFYKNGLKAQYSQN